jgi:hypothetical protein
MNMNEFAIKVAEKEGGKININIAQIKEILAIANDLVDNCLYTIVNWK